MAAATKEVTMPDLAEFEGEDEKAPVFMRMTPLEVDLQLQAAQLVFQSILQGKRLGVSYPEELESWQRDTLGTDWVVMNKQQRRQVQKSMAEEGEHTPMWMEALADMGDIAWEVLETGREGEKVREKADIDRQELLEKFKELEVKVRTSYFARCGAGDRLYGLRACVAVLRLFVDDDELLGWCVKCLRYAILENTYNRDGLAQIYVPLDRERLPNVEERGWSFLRAALGALISQAEKNNSEVVENLVACIASTKPAPVMARQLSLLRKAGGAARQQKQEDDDCEDFVWLCQNISRAYSVAEKLQSQQPQSPEIADLCSMLNAAMPPKSYTV